MFILSRCVLCSPVWRFCTTWMTSYKGPIPVTWLKKSRPIFLDPVMCPFWRYTFNPGWVDFVTVTLFQENYSLRWIVEFCKADLTFESVVEILWSDHPYETSVAWFYLSICILRNGIWNFCLILTLATFWSNMVDSRQWLLQSITEHKWTNFICAHWKFFFNLFTSASTNKMYLGLNSVGIAENDVLVVLEQ